MAAVEGRKELKRNLAIMRRNIESAAQKQMDFIAEDALARSNAIAPQLSGLLISKSGIRKFDGKTFVRSVFYDTPYAVVQHEGIHPKTGAELRPGPVTRAKPGSSDGPAGKKYLERVFNNHLARWQKEMARTLFSAIKRSVR